MMSINDYEVDFDNIDSFLSAIQGPMEVLLLCYFKFFSIFGYIIRNNCTMHSLMY